MGDTQDTSVLDSTRSMSIDEGLYSRQLYVLGHDAMHRMQSSSVLIVGLRGLGMEIAKNVILAGVKAVFLLDDSFVSSDDLSSAFYFTECDVGTRRRSEACLTHLASLNRYVHVEALSGALSDDFLKNHTFTTVVMTESPISVQIDVNRACHGHGIGFISADVFGVAGAIFVDLGDSFVVSDVDGEQPLSGMIASITQDERALVTVYDDARHGLSTGDWVRFEEVQGMVALNSSQPRQITVTGPYTFTIDDTRGFERYRGGGYFHQVKQPAVLSFQRLQASLADPQILMTDFGKCDLMIQLHLLYQALSQFEEIHNRKPGPCTWDDANELVGLATKIGENVQGTPERVNVDVLARLARCAASKLAPMVSVIGGIAAQEVLKSCSGKFTPLRQHLYLDAVEALPDVNLQDDLAEFAPLSCRDDPQIAIFGRTVQEKLASSKVFLVGSGAIGCEMLKNWAMMGVATGDHGQVVVTDMDVIEKSNLNRQFLFRPSDVGHLKSSCAARAASTMNSRMHVIAHSNRVSGDTEDVYDDAFWDGLDFVCTALDNLDARLYVDQRCVYFQKPLLESGTMGTKGNTQVVVPFLTESYGSSRDPPEESIPICTLKNFPNKIEHTIQWARDTFEGWFTNGVNDVNAYLSSMTFLEDLAKEPNSELETLRTLHSYLVQDRPLSFAECIVWARLRFEDEFNYNIRQLLHNFPPDAKTSSGTDFWSGPKRAPAPLAFDKDDDTHLSFVIAAANLRAFNYGLAGSVDPEKFRAVLADVMVPDFAPKENLKIATSEEELENGKAQVSVTADDEDRVFLEEKERLLEKLPLPSSLAGFRLQAVEFDKDDESNFHMDFITMCSNLRARCYRIKEESCHETKRIAGKIIPAIATTTAMVSGLICLEMFKLVQNKPVEAHRCCFASLALPLFSIAEPVPPAMTTTVIKSEEKKWSIWDRIDIDIGDVTLRELLAYFKVNLDLDVEMLSFGPSLLHAFFSKSEERMRMRMSEIVESVAKVKLSPKQKYLVLEVCVVNSDGDDVEIPYIRFKFRP